jgi:hypothetical protein
MKKYIFAFLLGLSIGIIPAAHSSAAAFRGYSAVGGEILLPVVVVVGWLLWDTAKETIKNLKEDIK